jgi:hypothetical protein
MSVLNCFLKSLTSAILRTSSGGLADRIANEISPDPMRTAPAMKPDVPAVMSSILFEARYKKLMGMPNPPAIIAKNERTTQTGLREFIGFNSL